MVYGSRFENQQPLFIKLYSILSLTSYNDTTKIIGPMEIPVYFKLVFLCILFFLTMNGFCIAI